MNFETMISFPWFVASMAALNGVWITLWWYQHKRIDALTALVYRHNDVLIELQTGRIAQGLGLTKKEALDFVRAKGSCV